MHEIDFWFSIGSTYTYLSVNRIAELAKKENLIINWMPFSVRKIMMDMDNIPFTPPSKKVKSDYMWRDIERRAKFYGFFLLPSFKEHKKVSFGTLTSSLDLYL